LGQVTHFGGFPRANANAHTSRVRQIRLCRWRDRLAA